MEEVPNTNTNTNNLSNENLSNNGSDTGGTRINIEEMIGGLIEIPIIRSRRNRRRRQNHYDISESFESMHQNINTLNNMINCKNKFDEEVIRTTKTIVPYDLNKMRYEVGQWLDAKDTIDQWLEAQVVQVRNNQVYIHYNGWGTRWDEWIDMNSPRIAPFK